MNVFFNIFQALFELGSTVITFIDKLITGISSMADYLDYAFSSLPDLFIWLPDAVFVSISGLICIVILYKLIGREG